MKNRTTKAPSLDAIGQADPHAFFVKHEGKQKKNPHYVRVVNRVAPAAKRKPAK
jgi:hypothetical protein